MRGCKSVLFTFGITFVLLLHMLGAKAQAPSECEEHIQKTPPVPNGCGSDGYLKFPPDMIPLIYDFGPACDDHDTCYQTCSDDPGHKTDCDVDFLSEMKDSCGLLNVACQTYAIVFYEIVKYQIGQVAYNN